jgi:AmmeMemoRadiSam system radical SAM enzyme/AmmeMemoRadiSam system protein B/AmmeMemoRadiSam system protein A
MSRVVTLPPLDAHRENGSYVGGWWHTDDEQDRIVCDLCPREWHLKPGDRGFCFVRQNVGGEMLLTTYGHSTGFCVDPIEKKPLNHFFPGTPVLSFGTAGCNLGCKFCQNWDISKSREVTRLSEHASPETIARAANQLQCRSVAYTYNDPVIWTEYAIDTAKECRQLGIKNVAVTAGYITTEARSVFFAEMDAVNVDLKAFSEQFYYQLTYSHLQPVLDTLEWLHQESDVWYEITNLIIPQENDSPDELRKLCDWILTHLDDKVPVHFTAFHPDFRMRDRPQTPIETLLMAYDIARQQGLKYVYVGNVLDPVHDSTYCHECSKLIIERNWHQLGAYHLHGNQCEYCGATIPGHFDPSPGSWGRRRLPVRIRDYAQDDHSETNGVTRMAIPSKEQQTSTSPDKPSAELSESQELQVHRAACELIAGPVLGRAPSLSDPSLGGVALQKVMGAFVTLKRQGHLRACCGTLGRPMDLLAALQQSAARTATQDMRLPPISATELPFLTVDVSLLHNFQPLVSQGEARANDVVIGQHGLTIRRGEASGLLLPSVPVEHNWDAETFLRQVCRKAGLPSTAWLEEATQLQTFEAVYIEGDFDVSVLGDSELAPASIFTAHELALMKDTCRRNLLALLERATPSYYIPGCSDGTAQAIALSISASPAPLDQTFSRLSMRPGLPVQSTLFQLTEAAANWARSKPIPAAMLSRLRVDVALLHDSALHGTVSAPDLQGIDPKKRALMVIEQGNYGLSYDPEKTPAQLLRSACDQVHALNTGVAGVISFATETSAQQVSAGNVPRPQSGRAVRPAAVAGSFYPDRLEDLDRVLDECLGDAPSDPPRWWPAAMVPHAGLRYSGRIAAAVLQQLVIPERVIILGPKHTRYGVPWAVAPHEAWTVPNGTLQADLELAERLADTIPDLEMDAAAHQQEHAIEVELPFLARLAPECRVTGIVLGGGDLGHCQAFATGLAQVIRELDKPPLLIISSDMNHYATDRENRRLDQIALDAIHQLDPAIVYHTVRDHNISMCGVLPAVTVMETLRQLDQLHDCRQVAYATSGDVSGERHRVVGYAGMLLGG